MSHPLRSARLIYSHRESTEPRQHVNVHCQGLSTGSHRVLCCSKLRHILSNFFFYFFRGFIVGILAKSLHYMIATVNIDLMVHFIRQWIQYSPNGRHSKFFVFRGLQSRLTRLRETLSQLTGNFLQNASPGSLHNSQPHSKKKYGWSRATFFNIEFWKLKVFL